ncbi:GNAT family N-acetyltransferase [Ectobacillus ponti]|uniref:GNAT family N-acetyltransferase n=1 Tax=Ectobacillus ponti TaxID=2961894 RepID=A0AA41X4W3_9BACI|nr:GNAT family N-acetyltransferase [Ectobacillus ponti]MCP8968976.1 GNAT family N-acetyltransferase [Ectobacillus ponti]
MLTFEPVTEAGLDIVREIVHSNPDYNRMENGSEARSDAALREEFLHGDPARRTLFIKADDTYIGLLEYMEHNVRDNHPWLGLLMIHGDYQGYGYGANAYFTWEEQLRGQGHTSVRLGVLPANERARRFWEGLGFTFYEQKQTTAGAVADCFEKQLA